MLKYYSFLLVLSFLIYGVASGKTLTNYYFKTQQVKQVKEAISYLCVHTCLFHLEGKYWLICNIQ